MRSLLLINLRRCNGFLPWKYSSSRKTRSQQVVCLGTMCHAKQPFKMPVVRSHKQSLYMTFICMYGSIASPESLLYQEPHIKYLCQPEFVNNLIYWVSSLGWKRVALGLAKMQMLFFEAIRQYRSSKSGTAGPDACRLIVMEPNYCPCESPAHTGLISPWAGDR